jgi:hypothetical protein
LTDLWNELLECFNTFFQDERFLMVVMEIDKSVDKRIEKEEKKEYVEELSQLETWDTDVQKVCHEQRH